MVHPPFRWQREYARGLRQRDLPDGRTRRTCGSPSRTCTPGAPRPRDAARTPPTGTRRPRTTTGTFTLDLSPHRDGPHRRPGDGRPRWATGSRHVHLADGNGSAKDEHLVPGRGTQPCAELLERLAAHGFDGPVVIEVNTRRASPARNARPTSPRRWPSPGCTWSAPSRPAGRRRLLECVR